MDRPKVLVVAGYDQSAGAGVLADIKTLEAHDVYGYAAITGLTYQHVREIRRIQWLSMADIKEQIDCCFADVDFGWAKMGITENVEMAGAIVDHLLLRRPDIRIVWDPVIRASSGRNFWQSVGKEWKKVAGRCFLVTPNWEEIGRLYQEEDIQEGCRGLTVQTNCHLYLKGGHHPEFPGRDYLWSVGKAEILEPEVVAGEMPDKHGSGCVLSSALAANLALGYPLAVAAHRAKKYIEQFLASNKTLLGWHRPVGKMAGQE